MTEDELKGLTMGDKVYVRAEVFYVDSKGRECQVRIHGADGDYWWGSAKAEDVYRALPGKAEVAVKDVACRLFRKGDKVRVMERNGRSPILCGAVVLGDTYTVYADEDGGDVILDIGYGVGGGEPIAWSFLELVTPVEDLEPYFMYESKEEESFDIMKRVGKLYLTRNCIYYKSDINDHAELTREQAKAAAEAECDRLNAEWRKKVGTEVPCSEDGKERK